MTKPPGAGRPCATDDTSEGSQRFSAPDREFGITQGQTYPMDIFHAERHTEESNFRIETTIECFTPIDVK